MTLMRFISSGAVLLHLALASPVLLRRQGGGSGLPANATIPQSSDGNVTYQIIPMTSNGSSFLDAKVVSSPLGVNTSGWEVSYSNGSEPYAGAHLILGNPAYNATNETLAWPGQPAGGLLDSNPDYTVKSNFDFQSLNLALNQELIELDLFHNILARFSTEEFEDAGLDADDRTLIQHMADQEVGHAIAITNMLGVDRAAKQCVYKYPYNTVQEAILFSQLLTRWGEAGVYGFLNQLDSRPSAQILLQSITTEARQQMIFRQFQGLPAQPEWFETGIPQSYAWTLLSPYIHSCPPNNPRIEFTRSSTSRTSLTLSTVSRASIRTTRSPRVPAARSSSRGNRSARRSATTASTRPSRSPANPSSWRSSISSTSLTRRWRTSRASAVVPNGTVFDPQVQVCNSVFVPITDSDPFLTPFTIPLIVNHTVAVGLYQAS